MGVPRGPTVARKEAKSFPRSRFGAVSRREACEAKYKHRPSGVGKFCSCRGLLDNSCKVSWGVWEPFGGLLEP
eukprot:6084936-Pyramimonas_sp.AAC.1